MYYCNDECQDKDWYYHWLECAIYNKHYSDLHDAGIRLLLRLYLTLERYPLKRLNYYQIPNRDPPQYRCYEMLTPTKEGQNEYVMVMTTLAQFETFLNRFRAAKLNLDRPKLFGHFIKMLTNCFNIEDNTENIALGIYILESFFQHSCVPNSCMVFNGTRIEVRTIKNI